jgi:hypothetical protein
MPMNLLGRECVSPSGLKISKSLHNLSSAVDIYSDGVNIYVVQASAVCLFCGALTAKEFRGYGVCHHCWKEVTNEGNRD